jgi:CubicO group peptidase (beta-lactamase class C family)
VTDIRRVAGVVAPGWEPAAEAFSENFELGLEVGAALTVYQHGVPVLDVWGGAADSRTQRPWGRDTVACIYSSTKGLVAICAHMLVQRGLLDLEAPVAQYWPEFADGGKQHLKVRSLLTHEAGLLALDKEVSLTLDDLAAVTPVLRAIERQTPLWPPGEAFGYHAVTFGYLVGEVIHRITGKTAGTFLRDEVAQPLGLDAVLGLPADADVDLAHMEPKPPKPDVVALHGDWVRDLVELSERSVSLGGAVSPEVVLGNDRQLLALELGGANMVSDARSLARAYAATVTEVDGVRLLDEDTARSCVPSQTFNTPPYGVPAHLISSPPTSGFGLGFMQVPLIGPSSFGHPGAYGSVGFADIDARLALGYVPNRPGLEGEDRFTKILNAVRIAASTT